MKKALENKLAQLNGETEEIFASLESLDEKLLRDKSNGWSVIQVLNHLQQAEGASLSYMKKKLLAGEKMGRLKAIHHLKMGLTKAALKTSLRWKAPKQVANPDGNFSLAEVRENWSQQRTALSEYVEQYPEKWLDRTVYRHPMAGRQGLEAAIDSFIYHQRHHVHQITRIRKKIAA